MEKINSQVLSEYVGLQTDLSTYFFFKGTTVYSNYSTTYDDNNGEG